jgi:predicted protein tyrosine phosphatase
MVYVVFNFVKIVFPMVSKNINWAHLIISKEKTLEQKLLEKRVESSGLLLKDETRSYSTF